MSLAVVKSEMSSGRMQIFVKTLTGKTIWIDLLPCHTVRYAAKKIERRTKIPWILPRLVFAGKPLEFPQKLSHYNITNESTIHVVLRNLKTIIVKTGDCEYVNRRWSPNPQRKDTIATMKREICAREKDHTLFQRFDIVHGDKMLEDDVDIWSKDNEWWSDPNAMSAMFHLQTKPQADSDERSVHNMKRRASSSKDDNMPRRKRQKLNDGPKRKSNVRNYDTKIVDVTGSECNLVEIKEKGLHLEYYPHFIAKAESTDILETMERLVEYQSAEESSVLVFGKRHLLKRKQTAFGDPGTSYKFCGKEVRAKEWSKCAVLLDIKDRIHKHLAKDRNKGNDEEFALRNTFNFVLP